jgi:hypothetical protein
VILILIFVNVVIYGAVIQSGKLPSIHLPGADRKANPTARLELVGRWIAHSLTDNGLSPKDGKAISWIELDRDGRAHFRTRLSASLDADGNWASDGEKVGIVWTDGAELLLYLDGTRQMSGLFNGNKIYLSREGG